MFLTEQLWLGISTPPQLLIVSQCLQCVFTHLTLSVSSSHSLIIHLRLIFLHLQVCFPCLPVSPTLPPLFLVHLWLTFVFSLRHSLPLHLCLTFWGATVDRSHLWWADWVTVAVPVDIYIQTHWCTQQQALQETETASGWNWDRQLIKTDLPQRRSGIILYRRQLTECLTS